MAVRGLGPIGYAYMGNPKTVHHTIEGVSLEEPERFMSGSCNSSIDARTKESEATEKPVLQIL